MSYQSSYLTLFFSSLDQLFLLDTLSWPNTKTYEKWKSILIRLSDAVYEHKAFYFVRCKVKQGIPKIHKVGVIEFWARSIFGIFIFQLQFRALCALTHTHIERGSLGRKTKVREVSSSVKLQSEFFLGAEKRQRAKKKEGLWGLKGVASSEIVFQIVWARVPTRRLIHLCRGSRDPMQQK